MKTCILVEYKSPAGSYWYHPDHPLCQDGQVLWEFPEEEDNTAVEMAALNFACAVMNKEPDDKVKSTIRELMEALIESELLKLPRKNP